MLKKILIAVLALIVLLVAAVVILAFAVKSDFKVEREITINRPKADVFAYVKNLKNQNYWGPWYKKDPAMKQEFKGQDGSPGFVASRGSGPVRPGPRVSKRTFTRSPTRMRSLEQSSTLLIMRTPSSSSISAKIYGVN